MARPAIEYAPAASELALLAPVLTVTPDTATLADVVTEPLTEKVVAAHVAVKF